MIIAGAASALQVLLAARRLHTSGGGYGLLAAIAAGAPTSPIPLTRLATRSCRPIVVFTAFGRRGMAGLVLAGITALPTRLAVRACYGVGCSAGSAAFASITRPHVPDGIRGRMCSGFGLIWPSMRLARWLPGGLFGGTAGCRAVSHLGGALLAAPLAGLIRR